MLFRLFDASSGKEYEAAQFLAEENAFQRLEDHNYPVLVRLMEAIQNGADPDLFAKRFRYAAGDHRADMARDLANAGRYIKRTMTED